MSDDHINYIYRKTPEGTSKVFFQEHEYISSLTNKPSNYWIKVNNRCIED